MRPSTCGQPTASVVHGYLGLYLGSSALFKGAVLAGARVVGARLLEGASGALLVLTGAYVIAYWLALGF